VLAFLRGDRVAAVATRLPVTLERLGGWRGTALALPAGTWRCALTGRSYEMGSALGDELPLERLTATLPVALLVKQDAQ
jgi:(1->4)-alpha-D-glucan 1-alpha-D-glucosylmutase